MTVSGLASTVTSAAGGSASSARLSASGSVKVGVPPPTNTVSSVAARTPALAVELREKRVDVAPMLLAAARRR